jgi:hypothetical protein
MLSPHTRWSTRAGLPVWESHYSNSIDADIRLRRSAPIRSSHCFQAKLHTHLIRGGVSLVGTLSCPCSSPRSVQPEAARLYRPPNAPIESTLSCELHRTQYSLYSESQRTHAERLLRSSNARSVAVRRRGGSGSCLLRYHGFTAGLSYHPLGSSAWFI